MDTQADLDELVANWTLVGNEVDLVAGKQGVNRLDFSLLLRYYGEHGRFPDDAGGLSAEEIDFVARQVSVGNVDLADYEWTGRTGRLHRAQIREHFGFRECSVDDAEAAAAWLAVEVCERERSPARVREEFLAWCRREAVEPPTEGRIDRLVRSALHRGELALTARIASRLSLEVRSRLDDLTSAGADDEDDDESGWVLMLAVPGNVSLNSMLVEIDKLNAVRAVGVSADVLADVAPSVVEGWRSRVAVESPSHLRTHPDDLRRSMVAAMLVVREREIVDALVELFIATVHRIGASAGRKVTRELTNAFKRVTGKENILFSIAEAAINAPGQPVRDVVFPAVTGGEATLQDLVHEYRTKGPQYQQIVRATLKASYTNHYRRGLIALLDVLDFRSNNTAHRPVLDALDLVKRHAGAGTRYFPSMRRSPCTGACRVIGSCRCSSTSPVCDE